MINIVIADCEKEELNSFMKELNKYSNEHYKLKEHIASWQRTGIFSELRRYFMYFIIPFKYFLMRKKYKNIIGWQQFYALIFCFYCSLFKVKKCNTVIAWNYTYKEKKGKTSKLYKWFMKRCLSVEYLDYIHVPSNNYADIISREFKFPRNRIIVATFGINDEYKKNSILPAPENYKKNSYILSIGRSNRDYDFLIKVWEKIDYKLVIISDTYIGTTKNPNITIRRDISSEKQYPWIANCKAVIIPIEDGTICSGDTVLLTSMSLEKIVIVTKPSTLAEMYIKDKENGLLVEKQKEELSELVVDVINSKYDYIGKLARKSFLDKFSRGQMGIIVADILNNHKKIKG